MRPSRAAWPPEPDATPAAPPRLRAEPAAADGRRVALAVAPAVHPAGVQRTLVATGGTVLAAVLYTAACPPIGCAVAAWAVPGLLLAATRRLRWRSAVLHGALFAVGIGFGITSWTYGASLAYFGFRRPLAAAWVTTMWVVYGGIPYGLLLVVHGRLRGRVPAWSRPLVGAWLWVVAEMLRSRLFTGLPWALLGHTQFQNLTLVQVADLGGVPAVSFVLALTSLAAVEAIGDLARARHGTGLHWRRLALPAVVLAATLGYGAHARRAYAVPVDGADAQAVLVVQGNVPNEFRWKRAFFERTLATYARLSIDARGARPDVIVWPENAVNFYVDREPMLRAQLATVATRARDGLVVGGPRLADDAHARNAAYLLDGTGAIVATYDKRRLVPFAEYDPFRGGNAGVPGAPVYTPGGDGRPLATARTSLGTVICYEVLFPHLVRDLVAKGAELLVNLSNDAWLDQGSDAARQQHFSMVVFRAIETRRFLVRAAANGVSGFVTPTGEPYSLIAADTAGAVLGRVVPRRELTPYVRFGETWVLVAGLGVVALAVRTARGARRA